MSATAKRDARPSAQIVKAHPRLHAAEGELYKRSVVERAAAVEWLERPAHRRPPSSSPGCSKAAGLRPPEVERLLAALGKASGPPWTKEQKECALAAWALLG